MRLCGFLVCGLFGWATSAGFAVMQASGSGGTGVAIGVIDVVRVFEDCDQIKDLNSLLRDANAGYQKEAESRRKALADKEVELSAFAPGTPDYQTRKKEFTRMQIEFNVWVQASRAELQRDHFNWTRVVYDEMSKAVGETAKEKGLTLVLQKREFKPEMIGDDDIDKLRSMIHARGLIWSDEGMDITDAVMKRMNTNYKEMGGRAKLNQVGKPK